MGGHRNPFHPRHSTNCWDFVLVYNFVRASSRMLRVWGGDATIAPLEVMSPPRTEVVSLSGISHENCARASGPLLSKWGVIAANAPLEILVPPRTEVNALPGLSIKNFARASGLMWRMWGVDSVIAPLEVIVPPRRSLPPGTEVLTLPGVFLAESNILPAFVNGGIRGGGEWEGVGCGTGVVGAIRRPCCGRCHD